MARRKRRRLPRSYYSNISQYPAHVNTPPNPVIPAEPYRTGNPGVWGTAGGGPGRPSPPGTTPPKKPQAGIFSGINPMLSEAELRKKALALIGPILDAQAKSVNETAAQRGRDTNAAYAALAEIAKGAAPVVRGAYEGAAGATTAAAKGFTDAVKAQQEGAAGNINDFLKNLGSPQQVSSGFSSGGADAAFATGGYIPASTMAREGAAFTSSAAQYPVTSAGLGVDAQKLLTQQTLAQIKELEAQRPGMVLEAVNSLRQSDMQRYSLQRNDRLAQLEFGTKQQQAKLDARLKLAQLSQEQRQWVAEMELDWAKLSQSQRKDALQAQRWAQDAGIDAANLDLRKKKYLLDVWKAEHGKKTSGKQKNKFTAKQLKDLRAEAATIAGSAFSGGVDAEEQELPPLDYADALWEMELAGIPAWMARNYLNRFYAPGSRGRPGSPTSRATAERASRGRRT